MFASPLRPLLFCLCLLCLPLGATSAVVISEFMAENNGFLFDQDYDSPDWIEIQNDGSGATNLEGWHLTDSPSNLTKWTLPNTPLPANGIFLVYASGKDRAVAGQELHANFQLDGDGGYLALVEPDGVTVAWDVTYPDQRSNVSFGTERLVLATPLVASGASGRLLVPTDDSLGTAWTQNGFDDSSWAAAATGIGYESSGGGGSGLGTPVLSIDFNDDDQGESGADNTEVGFTSMTLSQNPTTLGNITVTLSVFGGGALDDRDRATPLDSPPALTQDQLYDDFIFVNGPTDGAGARIHIAGLQANQDYLITIWSYDSSSIGQRVSDWIETASGTPNPFFTTYVFDGSVPPTQDGESTLGGTVRSSSSGELIIEGRRHGGTSHGVFLNALQLTPLGYGGLIATDTSTDMFNKNATAYLRIPFTVADASSIETLRLRMKYDDGFVAYINGQEAASRNAPASPQWNSSATTDHPASEALVFEEIIFANGPGLLVNGINVLAIHGLNVSAADGDFLVLPELAGVDVTVDAGLYLKPPTPGAVNGPGFPGFVEDTRFSVDRGFYNAPFTVEISTATTNAEIRWTTDGSEPTATTGTVYGDPIEITGTTLLRAAAFYPGLIPTDVDTQTYIFLDQVVQQSATQPGYPTIWQASYPADYGMDPNVVNDPNYGPALKDDLRSLPTLSIVADHDDLWGASRGIYNHATSVGLSWERTASVELIDTDGSTEFSVRCGLRMQGNASRDNVRTPKHNFRFLFKTIHGPSKLRYDWFGGGVDKFDNIVMRACFTDSWATRASPGSPLGARYRPEDATYLRDVWMKDSLSDMGQLSGRGRHVHVYVNGLYWGVYNPSERLDDSFFEHHIGGHKETWDVIRDFSEVLSGTKNDWNAMMTLVNGGINSEAQFQAVADLVDLDSLIDYMLLHIHGEAEDWPHHNWYAAHRKETLELPATKWIFLSWDQEIIADNENSRDRSDVNNDDTPARIYAQLRNWPEFRRMFGDRVQKHMFNNGALTVSNNIQRLQARVNSLFRAMTGESARWGDAREFATPGMAATGLTFTRDEFWVPELNLLYNTWFPNQQAVTINRLRNDNLYPSQNPPEFSPFGGPVPAGFELVMTHANASGTIYYTTNGVDPRVYGSGAIAPAAQAYSDPLILNSPTLLRARVLQGGSWSALVAADFFPSQNLTALRFNEIMYHPQDYGAFTDGELEFIELKNTGAEALDLTGIHFTSGITFAFTNGTVLGPGEIFLLGRNQAAITARYPGVTLNGTYTGQLDNGGERLTLSHGFGTRLLSAQYNDAGRWPILADGFGFSLVPRAPSLSPDPDEPVHWRGSSLAGGSPGEDDPASGLPQILISEILTHTDPPLVDFVELYNPSETEADVSGWLLSDDREIPNKYRIPPETTIPPGGYLVLDETQFNPTPGIGNSFTFSSEGEEVYLCSADALTNLTGYSDGFSFGAAANGVSFARYIISTGAEHYPAQIAVTDHAANSGPRVGPVVINQIMYHPPDDQFGTDNQADEFIELLNISASPVSLFDANGAWRLRDAVSFDFPPETLLPPGTSLLVVSFNPADEAARTKFQGTYGSLGGIPLFGPYSGKLDNSSDRVELVRPDSPNPMGQTPEILVERVHYKDSAPWPVAADGAGAALQRVSVTGYGNDPTNWVALAALSIQTQPRGWDVNPGESVVLTVSAVGTGTLSYQWHKDDIELPGATNLSYSIFNIQEEDQGDYTVEVSDMTGSIISQTAFVGVLVRPYIIQPPVAQTVVEGGDVTFSVLSGGHLPMGYRWRRGGATRANYVSHSHTSFFTIENVQLADEGSYNVILTNAAYVAPGILSPSASLMVVADGDGDGIPDGYESANGLNPEDGSDGMLDSDGDGSSNVEEYEAGTDPMDENSVLRVEHILLGDGLVTLEFLARADRTYSVEKADALDAPNWTTVAEFPANNTNRVAQALDVNPGSATRFYRVVTPRQQR